MEAIPIRLMKNRRYELLPVDGIVVLNSRDREQERFAENVQSIRDMGLLKPVLVNERFHKTTGKYELVCGEGRLIAHKQLGKAEIACEVIDCDRKQAYLLSLVENIARVPAGTMWFANELKRMHDAGMSNSEISRIVCRSESNVTSCITLAERGEERLLRGVEQGIFPIAFAMHIAVSDEAQVQNIMMDAFDSGLVRSQNLCRVRKIIKERLRSLGYHPTSTTSGTDRRADYTVKQLKRDIERICRDKKSFVREASLKERALYSLVEGLNTLRSRGDFMDLLKAERLAEMPELKGRYEG